MNIHFKPLTPDLFDIWAGMRYRFWEDDEDDCREALTYYQNRQRQGEALTLLAFDEADNPVGFTEGELRTDYVTGADERPVWYLEGIYVEPHEPSRCSDPPRPRTRHPSRCVSPRQQYRSRKQAKPEVPQSDRLSRSPADRQLHPHARVIRHPPVSRFLNTRRSMLN